MCRHRGSDSGWTTSCVIFFFLSRLSEPRMFRNLYVDKSGMAAQEDRFACLLTANSKFFWFCKNPNGSAEMIG